MKGLLTLLLLAVPVFGADVRLSWTDTNAPSISRQNTNSYAVSWDVWDRQGRTRMTNAISVTGRSVTITNLAPNIYYFTVQPVERTNSRPAVIVTQVPVINRGSVLRRSPGPYRMIQNLEVSSP